jgi:hypothetical protein
MYKQNVGRLDAWIRLIGGLAIITMGLIMGSWWGALGIVLVVTSLMGRCPIYSVLGFSTRGKRRDTVPS